MGVDRIESRGRVLVVDDEEMLRRPVQRILEAGGMEVTAAKTGQEAIELIKNQDFDTILSDIDMPELDGIQLLRMIRLRDLDVPVLLMTGKPDLSTATQAVALGALQYLIKPVPPLELVKAVQHAIRLHQIARIRRNAFDLVHGAESAEKGVRLEAQLSAALDAMWMAYQPIVHAKGHAAFAFEALLRTTDPSLPSPVAIIEAAERLGRLADVGRAVRRTVATAIPSAPPDVLIFVNLHPRDLLDDELYGEDAPLSQFASRVVLELTERASLHDMNDVRDRIAALRRLGFRLAVDDLGAGYSGLSSFASLEPEFVKLDMSLVRDVDTQPVKQKLIAALMAVCHELSIAAVTEGVETEGERSVLVDLGCPLLQGYLLGKPQKGFAARVA